jgi:hypothetical protein
MVLGNNTLSVTSPTVLAPGNYYILVLFSLPSSPVACSVSPTQNLYLPGNISTLPPNSSSWFGGGYYDFGIWALINQPVVSISGSNTICTGIPVDLTANGAVNYTWSTGALTNTISQNPTVTTTFSVVGTNSCGSSFALTTITVNPLPTLTLSLSNSVICQGSSSTISASGVNTCTWNTGPSGLNLIVSPSVTTTYTATGADVNGCINTASISQVVSICTGLSNSGDIPSTIIKNYGNGIFELETVNTQSIRVTDLTGRLILEQEVGGSTVKLDLSEKNNGLYYATLISSDNKSIIKLIKY